MKVNKMWLDGKPNQNPSGTTRINKNIILNKELGSIINEDGNLKIDSYGESKFVIGVIVLDSNDFVVFTKKADNNSDVGYVDNQLNYHKLNVIGDLNFSYDNPIHGRFQRNNNNEIIICYTDNIIPLRYFNLTKQINIDNVNVFADFKHPELTSYIEEGGNLKSGAWYPILQYEKDDEVVTSWIKDYNPVYIIANSPNTINNFGGGSIPNVDTGKSIRIRLKGVDTRFKKLRIGVVFQTNNVRTFYYIKSINITGSDLTTVISSIEQLTAITPDEVLIDKSKYKTVQNIAQLDNILYLQGLSLYQENNQQLEVNKIGYSFVSTLYDFKQFNGFTDSEFNNRIRHFQHGEVYAIYISLEWAWGWGKWWTCPGREALPGETDYTIGGFRKYQTQDTCTVSGELGYWENLDEEYPSTGYYPSGNVRHIKFPSIRWMKQNVYSGEPNYGNTKLDILNLKIKENTFSLNNFKDADGNSPINYRIGYAKRTKHTGLVEGQSIFIYSVDHVAVPEIIYTSLGINANYENTVGHATRHVVDSTKIRTFNFEDLFDKEASNVNYIKCEVELSTNVQIKIEQEPFNYANLRYGLADYTFTPTTIPIKDLIKVKKSQFIINNTILGNINNTFLEDTIHLELEESLPISSIHDINRRDWVLVPTKTILLTLLSLKNNCYSNFFNQEIVVCDTEDRLGFFGGDTYIAINSVVSFGTTGDTKESNNPAESANNANTPVNGTRIANLFLSESRFNINFRYINPATLGGSTLYAPVSEPYLYLPRLKRDQEPNQISQGYSRDYNAENDLTFGDIFNPNTTYDFNAVFDMVRGSPISSTGNIGSWLNFKKDDVYKLSKTRGKVVGVFEGKDFLIIHHENALFRTRTRTYIDTSGEEAFTGQGDIFEQEPEEIIYDSKGALGTQHRWSCYMSKYGYFWIDSEAKKVYQYNSQVTELGQNGLSNFFLDNLELYTDNPFYGSGFHIVVDEENKRLLLTKKNTALKSDYKNKFRGIWKSDQNFINSLNNGDIVIKDGKLVIYQP